MERGPKKNFRLPGLLVFFASTILAVPVLLFPGPSLGMGLGGSEPPPSIFTSEVIYTMGNLGSPARIALAPSGQLYVTDTAKGLIAVYEPDGTRVGTVKVSGKPLGIAVAEGETVICEKPYKNGKEKTKRLPPWCSEEQAQYLIVGDEAGGSVSVYVDGEFQQYLGQGSGEFLKPNGIAAVSGRVYVVDSKAHQVRAYSTEGAFLFSFGSHGAGAGQLDFPTDIAVGESLAEVYVSDWGNNRIAVFGLEGNWLRNLSPPLNGGGDPIFFKPAGLGVDPSGRLIVVDNALCSVTVMDVNGFLIDVFGYQNGAYWTGELEVPIDAVSDGVRVYVTSSGEGTINVFEASP